MSISFFRVTNVFLLSVMGLVVLGNAGCGPSKSNEDNTPTTNTSTSKPDMSDLTQPLPFFANVYKVAKSGDVKAWANVISKAQREKGPDAVQKHFDGWASEIISIVEGDGRTIEDIKASFHDDDKTKIVVEFGTKKLPAMRVILEDGALRINEN